jgi:hypothetical protein
VPAVPVPRVIVTPLEVPALPPAAPLAAAPITLSPGGLGTPVPPPPGPAAAPPVLVTATALHAAATPALLQAPFVLTFASWMGSLIGATLLFVGTRPLLRAGEIGSVILARTFMPVLAAALAALVGVLVVGWLAGAWAHVWELWAFRWLVMAASMATLTALLCLFGWLGLLAAVPLVFYQAPLAGLLAPPSAVPAWLAWIERAPLHQTTVGLRSLLIGGPANSIPWTALAIVLAGAIVATWAGTLLWSQRAQGANR